MGQEYPSFNDVEPSWADVNVTATVSGGSLVQTSDIAAVKWSRKVEVGLKKGTSGGRVMSRTQGDITYDASLTFYRGGLRRLVRALVEKAPSRGNQKRISLVGFDVMLQHTPFGETDIYQTKWKGCRYLGDSEDMSEGNDADQIEVPISTLEIVNIIDGVEILLI